MITAAHAEVHIPVCDLSLDITPEVKDSTIESPIYVQNVWFRLKVGCSSRSTMQSVKPQLPREGASGHSLSCVTSSVLYADFV
jgi:hypothetical protein